jgi:ornithine carbamoyltransferase
VLSRYVDAIMIRILDHEALLELAAHATVPVINGLTEAHSHPCQVMADIMTFEEHRGPIAGKTVAWTGDGNNVLASWVHAAARFGSTEHRHARRSSRREAEGSEGLGARGRRSAHARSRGGGRGADCVVTDTWVSMGDKEAARHNMLKPYQVNAS